VNQPHPDRWVKPRPDGLFAVESQQREAVAAVDTLLDTRPTTIAGIVAVLGHLGDGRFEEVLAEENQDKAFDFQRMQG
jgi:hypothetical protein